MGELVQVMDHVGGPGGRICVQQPSGKQKP